VPTQLRQLSIVQSWLKKAGACFVKNSSGFDTCLEFGNAPWFSGILPGDADTSNIRQLSLTVTLPNLMKASGSWGVGEYWSGAALYVSWGYWVWVYHKQSAIADCAAARDDYHHETGELYVSGYCRWRFNHWWRHHKCIACGADGMTVVHPLLEPKKHQEVVIIGAWQRPADSAVASDNWYDGYVWRKFFSQRRNTHWWYS